jgi:hypothetical protein
MDHQCYRIEHDEVFKQGCWHKCRKFVLIDAFLKYMPLHIDYAKLYIRGVTTTIGITCDFNFDLLPLSNTHIELDGVEQQLFDNFSPHLAYIKLSYSDVHFRNLPHDISTLIVYTSQIYQIKLHRSMHLQTYNLQWYGYPCIDNIENFNKMFNNLQKLINNVVIQQLYIHHPRSIELPNKSHQPLFIENVLQYLSVKHNVHIYSGNKTVLSHLDYMSYKVYNLYIMHSGYLPSETIDKYQIVSNNMPYQLCIKYLHTNPHIEIKESDAAITRNMPRFNYI